MWVGDIGQAIVGIVGVGDDRAIGFGAEGRVGTEVSESISI